MLQKVAPYSPFKPPRIIGVLFAVLIVVAAYGATRVLVALTPTNYDAYNAYNVSLTFLVACMLSAGLFGFITGIISSVLSFLTINYFYFSPYGSFSIDSTPEKINLGLFMMFLMLVSGYVSYQSARFEWLNKREKRVQDLYTLTTRATLAKTRKETFDILEHEISGLLQAEVTVHLPNKSGDIHPPSKLSQDEIELFFECWETQTSTGQSCRSNNATCWRFEPLKTAIGRVGVLAICFGEDTIATPDWNRMITGIAAQAASIIQRIELSREMQESHVREEREKLRSMLLSSVSHDLKTPLASIIGSLSVYHSMFDRLNDEKKNTLTQTALEEAQRLDSFISNILDMTRLESGAIKFKPDWFNAAETVNEIVERFKQSLRQHPVEIVVTKDIDLNFDKTMMEQILQNILDNAAKYTPPLSKIRITIDELEGKGLVIIRDTGNGIPVEKHDGIFDKYTRLKNEDSQVAGTGLGLAIAKMIMEQQRGRISIHNHPEKGAIFSLFFPHYRIKEGEKSAA